MPHDQSQFLEVRDRDEAFRIWWQAAKPRRLAAESVPIDQALGRILAEDVHSACDVPGFERSNVDGFAVQSQDTFGAADTEPRALICENDELSPGIVPTTELTSGRAIAIATGGMIPRGADAVVMVEHVRVQENRIEVLRPVAPGANVSYAGSDVATGELVAFSGTPLTARETGVLAAVGMARLQVVRRPRVAIVSTGDELIAPGSIYRPGQVFDANARLLADAVREQGGEPVPLGIVGDDMPALRATLDQGLESADLVLLSGGTSKGSGDLSYRVLAERSPGVLVHGVALKPGKPICLGMAGEMPVAILPGFPTSAIFTFHEFVAPMIRCMAGLPEEAPSAITARMAMRANSERGRTEYLLVGLMNGPKGPTAYPMGKGSGSVTTFARADGFVVIPRHQEYLEADETVRVTPIGRDTRTADIVAIGSHCIGLDTILSTLAGQGVRSKSLWIGSQGGLTAAARGECDIAGTHLLDPLSDTYNLPFLSETVSLLYGYTRMQGLVHRPGANELKGLKLDEILAIVLRDTRFRMVSRNRGSGTRVIIDKLLGPHRPPGCTVEVRSHHAVAAAVLQGRADWGVTIEPVARLYGLDFHPIRLEEYDFAVPRERRDLPAICQFVDVLRSTEMRDRLESLGFRTRAETGTWAN